MKIKNKIIGVGAVISAVAPVAATMACGSESKNSNFWMEDKSWSVNNLASSHFDETKLNNFGAELQKQVDAGFPGMAVKVTKNGHEIFKHAYGYAQEVINGSGNIPPLGADGHAQHADKANWRAMTTNTMFDLASNTKMYSANYLAMIMSSTAGMAHINSITSGGNKVFANLEHGIPVFDEHGAQKTTVNSADTNEVAVNGKVYDKTFNVHRKIYEYMPEYIKDTKYIDEHSGDLKANSEMQDADGTTLDKKRLTLLDMISHTGGYSPEILFFNRNVPESQKNDANKGSGFRHIEGDKVTTPYQLNSNDPVLTKQLIVRKVGLTRSPKGKHIYSDTDFMLLGIILERIFNGGLQETQAAYDRIHGFDAATTMGHTAIANFSDLNDICTKVIYQPMGLTHTSFNPLDHGHNASEIASTAFQGNTRDSLLNTHYPTDMYGTHDDKLMRRGVITGTVHDEKSYYTMGGVSGHAGLFSSVDDISKMQLALLNGGATTKADGTTPLQLMDQGTIDKFIAAADGSDKSYGIGWRRNPYWGFGTHTSDKTFGHSGWTGIWAITDPESKVTVTYFTNKKHTSTYKKETGAIAFRGDTMPSGRYDMVTNKIYECLVD